MFLSLVRNVGAQVPRAQFQKPKCRWRLYNFVGMFHTLAEDPLEEPHRTIFETLLLDKAK